MDDSGDDRLSRRRHYHGPGGLNGRVRNGNGWDPASLVTGKAAAGRSGPAVATSVVPVTLLYTSTIAGQAGVGRISPRRGPVECLNRQGFLTMVSRCARICRPRPRAGKRGGRIGVVKRSAVRTGRLRRSPAVHSRPIDLVVFQEPLGPIGPGKPRLGGGFALRCLQRLSGPDLATRRCPERDSRHTRGRSSPILSY